MVRRAPKKKLRKSTQRQRSTTPGAQPTRSARTAGELAEHLGGRLEGDARLLLSGVASPENATAADVIYLESSRQSARAIASAASCVLTGSDVALPGKTILRTENPKLAFARAAQWLLAPQSIARGIHATAVIAANAKLGAKVGVGPYAVIEEDVTIGAGTEIGAFGFVGRGVRIGSGCRLHPHVTLYAGSRLGREVIIHSGAVIGGDGFGYVFDGERYVKFPQIGTVEIGDHVEIGANTCVDRGALGVTRIDAGVKLDNLVQVGHNVEIGEHSVVASQTGISGSSVIGRRVALSGQVGIGDHCRIEDGAIVGGQAGILNGKTLRRGEEPYWGTPARPLSKFKEQHAWLSVLPELGKDWREKKKAGKRENG